MRDEAKAPATNSESEPASAATNAESHLATKSISHTIDMPDPLVAALMGSSELELSFRMRSMHVEIKCSDCTLLASRRVEGCFAYDRYEIGDENRKRVISGESKIILTEKGGETRNCYWIDNYHSRMHVIEYPPDTTIAFTVNRVGFKRPGIRLGEDSTWFDAHLRQPKPKTNPKAYIQIQQPYCTSVYRAVKGDSETVGTITKQTCKTRTFVHFEETATLTDRLIILDFAIYCANSGVRLQNIVPGVVGVLITLAALGYLLWNELIKKLL